MPLIEISDQGLERLQTLDPQSNEARILSALESSGPVQSEVLLKSLNPQQQKQVVDTLTNAGVIEISDEATLVGDIIPPIDLSTGFRIDIPPISTGTEVHIPDIHIPDVKISPNGNIVDDFTGFSGAFERPEQTKIDLPESQVGQVDLEGFDVIPSGTLRRATEI